MVNFGKIVIEGFNSIGNLELDLNLPGLNFVKANNGVGKSTIFNALYWVLYGKHPKGLTASRVATWKQYRTKKFRGTRVTLFFSVGNEKFMLCRHYKFKGTTRSVVPENDLMLFKADLNGSFNISGLVSELHKRSVQSYLEDLLSMDEKSFSNALFFAQTAERLVQETDTKKRELFERICEIEWVKDAHQKAKEELTLISSKIDSIRLVSLVNAKNTLSEYEQKLVSYTNILSQFQDSKGGRIIAAQVFLSQEENALVEQPDYNKPVLLEEQQNKKLQTGLENLLGALDKVKYEVKSYKEMYESMLSKVTDYDPNNYAKARKLETEKQLIFRELERRNAELTTSFISYERKYTQGLKNVLRLEQDLESVLENCPTCGSPLSKEEVTKAKKSLISQIKAEKTANKVLQNSTETIRLEIEGIEKNKTQAKTDLDDAILGVNMARELEDKNTSFNRELENLKQKLDFSNTKLASWEKQIKEQKEDIANFKTESDLRIEEEISLLKTMYQERLNSKRKRVLDAEAKVAAAQAEKEPDLDIEGTRKYISEYEARILYFNSELSELEKEKEKVEFWVKTGFAAKGLKSFVFQTMLKRLNAILIEYAARLGIRVEFSIDLEKASKPIITTVELNGYPVNYKELSGGQQQKVNIILMFAMFDLIGKGKANVMVLDEPFKFLDVEAREMCFELITLKLNSGVNIFCITHLVDIDAVNANNIYLELKEGLTVKL